MVAMISIYECLSLMIAFAMLIVAIVKSNNDNEKKYNYITTSTRHLHRVNKKLLKKYD